MRVYLALERLVAAGSKGRGLRHRVNIVCVALACLMVAGEAGAQAQQLQNNDISDSVFRTGVDLVAFNVVVTDAQQKFVTGLSVDDFVVYEDGVQQQLSFFAAKDVPLDLALLLDTSASMTDKMQTMQEAAVGFAATLRPGDRVSINPQLPT